MIILIAASLIVTSRQYIGDPIDCIVDGIPLRKLVKIKIIRFSIDSSDKLLQVIAFIRVAADYYYPA